MSIIAHIPTPNRQKLIGILLMALLLTGCSLSFAPEVTPVPVLPLETPEIAATEALESTATPEGLYAPMSLPDGLRGELPVMQGICYEAALDAAGRVFILRNAIDHIRFYAEADQAQLCRHPVTRYPFDFETGRVLAGFWQVGQGCSARHDVVGVTRDEAKKLITLRIAFITEGDCGYSLVRPFWISIPDAAGWEIEFVQE